MNFILYMALFIFKKNDNQHPGNNNFYSNSHNCNNSIQKKISEKLKIIDFPDEIRKIHKTPTPLIGGLIIILSFILIHIYLISVDKLTLLDIHILIFCLFSF